MNKISLVIAFVFCASLAFTQSYAPKPGVAGSTAIHKDSSAIVAWATNCSVQRGYLRIDDKAQGYASYGGEFEAIGKAEGNATNIVSLGDSGVATISIFPVIFDGPGADFAIFENGFTDDYLELAFVEVSSNGLDFHRFPAYSETPIDVQKNNASYIDCRYVHNLAGKYKQGYGTPFDLSDLDSVVGLDLNAISHIRIIDVIGNIDPNFASYDALGRTINDPWPTAFESGGFDLDAVGFIHQHPVGMQENGLQFSLFPNPFMEQLIVQVQGKVELSIFNATGRLVYQTSQYESSVIETSSWSSGVYLVQIQQGDLVSISRMVK